MSVKEVERAVEVEFFHLQPGPFLHEFGKISVRKKWSPDLT